MNVQLPMRWSIPAALLLLGVLLIGVSHYSGLRASDRTIEIEQTRRIGASGSRLAAYLERDYRRNDLQQVRDNLLLVGFEPYIVQALLLDANDGVLAASQLQADSSAIPGRARPVIARVRQTSNSHVVLTADKNVLLAAFPVRLHLAPSELRARTLGVLYMEFDLRPSKAMARADLANRTLVMSGIVVATLLGIWLLFGLRLTRRVEQLTTGFDAVAQGDLDTHLRVDRRDELGRIAAAFNRMVAQLKESRSQLEQSESRYRRLVDASPDSITITSPERVVFANAAGLRLLGARSLEELHQRLPVEFVAPEDRAAAASHMAAALAGNDVPNAEFRLLRIDGEIVHASVALVGFIENGESLIQVIARDVTSLKHQEESLRRSEALLANIVGSALDAIVSVDAKQCITLFNRAAEQIFGWRADEVIGKALEILLPERFRLAHREHLTRLGESEVTTRAMSPLPSLTGLRRTGEEFPLEASISHSYVGNEHTFTVVARDLTERVRAVERQARLERQLQHSQRMQSLGTLAGGIAHDFNNILLAITGNTRLALEDAPPDHPLRTSLEEIERAARRATDLVRRMLTFSRANDTQRQPLEIAAVTQEAVRLLRAATPAMIDIKTDFARDLPNVNGDPAQIHQLIMNLGTNAIHAMDDGPGTLEVRAEAVNVDAGLRERIPALTPGPHVRIAVADTGRGMDAAMVERIFDPFFTTKPPGQGTGLGLSIVHGIVAAHDGAIHVRSAPGKGTRVEVYLPATLASSQQLPVAPARVNSGARQNVLYVDDEESLVFLISRMLGRLNYNVRGFTDPARALAAFRAHPDEFDVFISDIAMPGMSGFDLVSAVREIRPDIPILMTSGHVRPQDRDHASRLGVRDLILKPNTVEELASSLHQLFLRGTSTADPSESVSARS